jgi:hypothetical protein
MIDNFALALSHGLLILAVWRLLARPDLDDDSAAVPAPGNRKSLFAKPFARTKEFDKAKDRAGA